MFYVYILKSLKDGRNYVGYTNDLKRRVSEHNSGKVRVTRNRRPFRPIYYEAYCNQQDATEREKYFKTGWGRSHLKKVLKHYLEEGS